METPNISIEEQVEAFKAWRNGETIQRWCVNKVWMDTNAASDCYLKSDTIIRRKPSPKLRPWKPEEVPKQADVWFRRKSSRIWWRMCFFDPASGQASFADETGRHYEIEELLGEHEHSVDNGKTWTPCGTYDPC